MPCPRYRIILPPLAREVPRGPARGAKGAARIAPGQAPSVACGDTSPMNGGGTSGDSK